MKKTPNSHVMIPFIISLAFFMEAVDSTILNTAIPAISRSLVVDPVDLKVALISYLLSLAIFIPISGWLADKFGAKKTFISALAIFTLSSLWCGFSDNLIELMIARFVQGFGSAFGMPVGRLILMRVFGRENLINTMSRVIIFGALGMMLGPMIGGFITHNFSWHWIFWVNIPVGISAILLSAYWLPITPPKKMPKLDKVGFVLFGSALAGFTFGLSALSQSTLTNSLATNIILVSIILFAVYFLHSKKQKNPIVKTDLFYLRTFQISLVGNLISRLGFGGIPFLIPLLLQVGLGFSAQLSGVLLAPTAIGLLFIKPFALPLLRKLGYRKLLILNTIFAGLSIWSFMLINVNTAIYVIASLTFMYGFILSLQYSAMNSLAYADIPGESLSSATSIMGTLQQLSQSFGVAISALFIRLFSNADSIHHTLTLKTFHYTFFAIGSFTLISTLVFFRLKNNDGEQMIK